MHTASLSVFDITLPFKKCWHEFEVSKYAFVKSFKEQALDPIVLNRTTGYCHETFTKHCLFAPQCSKKMNRKIFLGQKHGLKNF